MKVIRNELGICYDVDDTLVMSNYDIDAQIYADEGKPFITILDPNDDKLVTLKPHLFHIALLKKHKARGYHVTVWSHAGFAWAEAVVKALDLEEYVDVVRTKPRAMVDDMPIEQLIAEQLYFGDRVNG